MAKNNGLLIAGIGLAGIFIYEYLQGGASASRVAIPPGSMYGGWQNNTGTVAYMQAGTGIVNAAGGIIKAASALQAPTTSNTTPGLTTSESTPQSAAPAGDYYDADGNLFTPGMPGYSAVDAAAAAENGGQLPENYQPAGSGSGSQAGGDGPDGGTIDESGDGSDASMGGFQIGCDCGCNNSHMKTGIGATYGNYNAQTAGMGLFKVAEGFTLAEDYFSLQVKPGDNVYGVGVTSGNNSKNGFVYITLNVKQGNVYGPYTWQIPMSHFTNLKTLPFSQRMAKNKTSYGTKYSGGTISGF